MSSVFITILVAFFTAVVTSMLIFDNQVLHGMVSMSIATLSFLAAFFHAVAAAIQQILRKWVLNVASTFQVGAGIFGAAAIFLIVAHVMTTGSFWFPNASLDFWLVLSVFIIANSVAVVFSLQVLQGETLAGAMLILIIAAGLLAAGDIVFFGQTPNAGQAVGILLLIVGITLFSGSNKKGKTTEVTAGNRYDRAKVIMLAKAIIALAIYNFVTPVTNKYCALATTATFSAWTAHAGIALTLLIAHAVMVFRKRAVWGIDNNAPVSGGAFLFGLTVMGLLSAMSNGLLAWSFELGGSIPAALMMKRSLPPIIVFLFSMFTDKRAGKKIQWRQAVAIAAATGGTIAMAP